MAKGLMFQGTGSDVGKTALVAGLCRIAQKRGLRVFPFKPQNMSNNAAVTENGEISRAQWLQAFAAKTPALLSMNPVLLKPQGKNKSQVIVNGQMVDSMSAAQYSYYKKDLLPVVLESYHALACQADLILVEGAGSTAEVNLRENDIANMGFARQINIPTILVADIDRGGVIASLVGTKVLLSEKDNALIKGFIINKFRGDVSLFTKGLEIIKEKTAWENFGILPWIDNMQFLPQEDSLSLKTYFIQKHFKQNNKIFISQNESLKFSCKNITSQKRIKICIPIADSVANFDDIDPLYQEQALDIIFVRKGESFPLDAKLVLLLGTKNTIKDMEVFHRQGWTRDILYLAQKGCLVIGLCGGYQMLGKKISDPLHIEGEREEIEGIGLLDIETVLATKKITKESKLWSLRYKTKLEGYEIHIGRSFGKDCQRPVFVKNEAFEGAVSENGAIWGSYMHGIFHSDDFRTKFLQELGVKTQKETFYKRLDKILDNIAEKIENSLDVEALFAQAKECA